MITRSGCRNRWAVVAGTVRPIEAWRQVHWKFFTRVLAPLGKIPTADMPVTLERFEIVCPRRAP